MSWRYVGVGGDRAAGWAAGGDAGLRSVGTPCRGCRSGAPLRLTKNQEGALRKGALSFKLGFWVGQELRLLAPRVRLRGIRRLRVNLDVATDESSSIIYAGYAGLGGGLIECAADQVCKRRVCGATGIQIRMR